jgi:tRNA-splicing ligase RtcB
MGEEAEYHGPPPKVPLKQIDQLTWEIPTTYKPGMKVPGRIYADQKLIEKMRTDRTLEQCANVAHLPGIYKYSITLPDGHEGYGFPIGGVAATDYENGVISPGGVGYDINCLPPDTKILTEHGSRVPIEASKGGSVLCINGKRSRPTNVLLTLRRNDNRLHNIITKTGLRIKATADHPILTPHGMVEAAKLKPSMKVATHPFEGVEHETPEHFTILEKQDITETVAVELERRKLVPLCSDDPKLPALAKLLGYFIGDGTFDGKITRFYGSRDGLEEIRRDVERLGYKPSPVITGTRTFRINGKTFIGTEDSVYVSAKSFRALLEKLGAPAGKKTQADFAVPAWIKRLPRWLKRQFLAAYLGAEMNKPQTINGYNFEPPVISVTKEKNHVKSGVIFLDEIAELAEEFDVEVCGIRTEDHGEKVRLKLQLSESPKSLLNLWSKIGYIYCPERQRLAVAAVSWLRWKQRVVQEREEVAVMAAVAHGKGSVVSEINPQLNSPWVNRRFIERSVYEGRRTSPSVPQNFPTFEDWLTENLDGDVVWDEIEHTTTERYEGPVYDITVEDDAHNFVAEGFIVSNCGVRLLRTNLTLNDIQPHLPQLIEALFRNIPSGLGSRGQLHINPNQLDQILAEGVDWAIANGFGWAEDREHCEENGHMKTADPAAVSRTAKQRGLNQVGSLGSGNHFLEIQKVQKIHDPAAAKALGITQEGQVTIMIHTGSRGLGHQVCSDYLQTMEQATHKYKIQLPDRELAAAPAQTSEAQNYYKAMSAAANYAWANRQMITHWTRQAVQRVLHQPPEKLDLHLIYDVAHNIAKIETHNINNHPTKVWCHRKGATRCFPKGHEDIPADYRSIGQPAILPGTMQTASYLMIGAPRGMELSFGSTAHGAGRMLSRAAAKRQFWGGDIKKDMEKHGILVRSASTVTLSEEAGPAYKDIREVAQVSHDLGIATLCCLLVPVAVTKG